MNEDDSKPLFYLRDRTIHKRPVTKKIEDNRSSTSLGFPICTVSEWADAEEVLNFFNEHGT